MGLCQPSIDRAVVGSRYRRSIASPMAGRRTAAGEPLRTAPPRRKPEDSAPHLLQQGGLRPPASPAPRPPARKVAPAAPPLALQQGGLRLPRRPAPPPPARRVAPAAPPHPRPPGA